MEAIKDVADMIHQHLLREVGDAHEDSDLLYPATTILGGFLMALSSGRITEAVNKAERERK